MEPILQDAKSQIRRESRCDRNQEIESRKKFREGGEVTDKSSCEGSSSTIVAYEAHYDNDVTEEP
jgi:hypothetical protein